MESELELELDSELELEFELEPDSELELKLELELELEGWSPNTYLELAGGWSPSWSVVGASRIDSCWPPGASRDPNGQQRLRARDEDIRTGLVLPMWMRPSHPHGPSRRS